MRPTCFGSALIKACFSEVEADESGMSFPFPSENVRLTWQLEDIDLEN